MYRCVNSGTLSRESIEDADLYYVFNHPTTMNESVIHIHHPQRRCFTRWHQLQKKFAPSLVLLARHNQSNDTIETSVHRVRNLTYRMVTQALTLHIADKITAGRKYQRDSFCIVNSIVHGSDATRQAIMEDATLADINRLYTMICSTRPGRLRLARKTSLVREFQKYRGVHPAQRLVLHLQMSPGITRQSSRALLRHVLSMVPCLSQADGDVIFSSTSIVLQTGDTILSMLSNAKKKSAEYVKGTIRP